MKVYNAVHKTIAFVIGCKGGGDLKTKNNQILYCINRFQVCLDGSITYVLFHLKQSVICTPKLNLYKNRKYCSTPVLITDWC